MPATAQTTNKYFCIAPSGLLLRHSASGFALLSHFLTPDRTVHDLIALIMLGLEYESAAAALRLPRDANSSASIVQHCRAAYTDLLSAVASQPPS